MTRNELAKRIFEVSHITGEFKLRSGQTSTEYFDKYRFEADPELLRALALELTKLIPEETQVLAGLEVGGIPVATALALETDIPMTFVRKKAKDYGTCQLAEGTPVTGKNICIIEDVITTGGQVIESTQQLRELGATVKNVICVIYRGEGPTDKLESAGLNVLPLFTMEELKSSK